MKGKLFALLVAGLWSFLIPQESSAEDKLFIEKMVTPGVSVAHASAHARGENLVVTGQVNRAHKMHVPGHVDIAIYNPQGTLLGVAKAPLPGIMSRRKGHMDVTFSSRFAFVPPAGSRIQMQYHWRPSCLTKKGLENS